MQVNINPKGLVVEDDEIILDVLVARFASERFDAITAVNGQDRMDKTYSEKPDTMLLDVVMPILGGFQFVKKIKGAEALRMSAEPF
ncbi:MAG: response regulator [Candidatus Omnitrophota bacterium]